MAESKLSGSLMATLGDKTAVNFAGKYFFPSDDIDVDKKNAGWHLNWCQAIWSLFLTGGCYNTPQDYSYISLMRRYGAGVQPNDIYKDMLIGSKDINPERKGWLSTNWQILSPAPKLHREIRGRFESQEFDYVATAVDPTSQSKKEEEMWDIWFKSNYGEQKRAVMALINAEEEEGAQYIAQSLEELELFREMGGFKLKSESELETVLDMTDYISDIKTIKQKCIDDLVDIGKTAFRDYYDPVTGTVKYEYVDWDNLVIDVSNEKNFKDIRFWGYVKMETINAIRVKAQNLEESELISIAIQNIGLWGNINRDTWDQYSTNGYRTTAGVRVYDNFRVPTFICEWLSTDTEFRVSKKNKAGENVVYPKTFEEVGRMDEKNKANLKTSRVNNVYQATWILGTNYVCDWGKSLNSARPNPKEPRLSIHASAIPGKSIVESIIPVLDQIELAWLRWQSAIAQAAPAGMDFDLSQLENVSIGGKKLNVFELIKLKRQTGDSIKRSTNLTNNKMSYQGKSVSRNEGGIGPFLNELILTLDKNFRLIAEFTGIDVVGSSLMTSGASTATEIKYAAASTVDALQPLFTSWVQMKEDAAITASCKIQRAIKHNPISKTAYEGMIGRAGAKILELGASKTPQEYGIKLEIRPTAEMKQAAIKAATEALAPGKNGENINLPDWWYFVNMIERGRAKQAMAILKYRLNKSKQEAIDMQRENMQLNGQNMSQQAQVKTQGNLMEIEAQGIADMKEEAVKALLQMNVSNNQSLNALKEQLIANMLMPKNELPQETAAA